MQNTKENLRKAERLVLLRKTMKLKQIDIAKELDIQQPNYCKIEKGLDYVPDRALKLLEDRFLIYRLNKTKELNNEIIELEKIANGNKIIGQVVQKTRCMGCVGMNDFSCDLENC